jgi:diaminopimelate decarboxylase
VRTAAALGVDLRVVNVGGGFGVDYLSDASIDLTPLRSVAVPAGVDLIFEPGRLLAADAGLYAAEVLDLKTTHGRTFAVLRGGTHHFRLPAAWGYSHPFTVVPVDDWPHPYPRPSVHDTPVDAVGELCTPRDVLTRGQHVPSLRAGDVLVFARTGAYGWDISHHDFLRHEPPEFVVR